MSDAENRFCWRCLLLALLPLVLLLALGWWATSQFQTAQEVADNEVDAMVEELADLSIQNQELRAELERTNATLSDVRSLTRGATDWTFQDLVDRVLSLPEDERRRLLERMGGDEQGSLTDDELGGGGLRTQLAALSPEERSRLWESLPEIDSFRSWFGALPEAERMSWISQMPNGDALVTGPEDADDGLDASLEQLRAELAERSSVAEDLRGDIEALTAEKASLEEANAQFEATIADLAAQLASQSETFDAADGVVGAVEALEDDARADFFSGVLTSDVFKAWWIGLDDETRLGFKDELDGDLAPAPLLISVPGEGAFTETQIVDRLTALQESVKAKSSEIEKLTTDREAIVAEKEEQEERLGELQTFWRQTVDTIEDGLSNADGLVSRVSALPEAEQAPFYDALTSNDAFSDWFAGLGDDEQTNLLAALTAQAGDDVVAEEAADDAVAAAQAELETVRRLNVASAQEIETLNSELADVRADLRRAMAENDDLNDRLAEGRAPEDESDLVGQRAASQSVALPGFGNVPYAAVPRIVAELQQDSEELSTEATELRQSLETARAARDALEAEMEQRASASEQENLIRRLRTGSEANASVADDLRQELASARSDRDAALSELARTQAALSDLRGALDGDIDAATALKDAEDEIASLTNALEQARADAAKADDSRASLAARLRNLLSSSGAPGEVGEPISLSANVAFETGAATLSRAGRNALAKIAEELKSELETRPSDAWRLVVEGHTDKRPINNRDFKSNWELSAARAASVAQYLGRLGVPEERMIAVGRAEFDPVRTGESPEALAANRRIEFEITSN